jgi:hypothetical protein
VGSEVTIGTNNASRLAFAGTIALANVILARAADSTTAARWPSSFRKSLKRSFATARVSVFSDFQINLPFNRTLA